MLKTGFVGEHSYDTSAWPFCLRLGTSSFRIALFLVLTSAAFGTLEQNSHGQSDIESYLRAAIVRLSDIDKREKELDERWAATYRPSMSEKDFRKNRVDLQKMELELAREYYTCARDLYERFEQYYKLELESEKANLLNRQQYLLDELYNLKRQYLEAAIKYNETGDDKVRTEGEKTHDKMTPLRVRYYNQCRYFRTLWKARFNLDFDFCGF